MFLHSGLSNRMQGYSHLSLQHFFKLLRVEDALDASPPRSQKIVEKTLP